MGTLFTIEVPAETPRELVEEAFQIASGLEELGTTYQPSSPLMLLSAGDPSFYQLPEATRSTLLSALGRAVTFAQQSGGAFHPATRADELASIEVMRRALNELPIRPLPWDLGGMLKGTAIDAMVAFFESKGISWALVNGGGDLRWYGKNQCIMIRKPGDTLEDEPLLFLFAEQGALATSANDRRFVSGHHGKQGHIKQAVPLVDEVIQASVFAETAELADVWATAVFVAGITSAKQWSTQYNFSTAILLGNHHLVTWGSHDFVRP
ncbi:MAG: FAD:protein FMN transferase [Acidobacteria bacterium]|nr:FAD:protein FMN transferase [Acidobacteriota bacterium]